MISSDQNSQTLAPSTLTENTPTPPTILPPDLVELLANHPNADTVLAQQKLSIPDAIHLLRKVGAKKQLAYRKELGHLHTKLLAHKYAPGMANRLLHLADSPSPIVALKAAAEILALSGLKKPATLAPKTPNDVPPQASALLQRKQEKIMRAILFLDQLDQENAAALSSLIPAQTPAPSNTSSPSTDPSPSNPPN